MESRREVADVPVLGFGVSYRQELREEILARPGTVDFLELISDHYADMPKYRLDEARDLAACFPIVLHGVEMSIGTESGVDDSYLSEVRRISEVLDPVWVSDHLCFTKVPGLNIGQLTPLSFSKETAAIASKHIRRVAAAFDIPFLVENISYYFRVPSASMSEAEFITSVVESSDAWLLLDLTNVHNNAINNGYDAYEFLDSIPLERVMQLHLAGGYYYRDVLLDTHSHAVPVEVFDMLSHVASRLPNLKGVCVERDQNFPPLDDILGELAQARLILGQAGSPVRQPTG